MLLISNILRRGRSRLKALLRHNPADTGQGQDVIVESSLPVHLSRRERRLALVVRMHGKELPPAALEAFAAHDHTDS